MDPEARLVAERAAGGWLRGDVIQALAPVSGLLQERYKVRGLDADGHPKRAFTDTDSGGYVAVRGDHPDCAAVRVYRAAGFEHAWLVVTTHRVAVLRLRDRQSGEPDPGEVRSLRGLGKFVKDSATEFVKSMRRAPLAERPEDATLECPVEPRVPGSRPASPGLRAGEFRIRCSRTRNSVALSPGLRCTGPGTRGFWDGGRGVHVGSGPCLT